MYVGDICLGSRLERVFPQKYSFGLSFTEEIPLPRGVREEFILKNFPHYYTLLQRDNARHFTGCSASPSL